MSDRPSTSFDIHKFAVTCDGCPDGWQKTGSGSDTYWNAYRAAAQHRKSCGREVAIEQVRRWVQGTARKDKAA